MRGEDKGYVFGDDRSQELLHGVREEQPVDRAEQTVGDGQTSDNARLHGLAHRVISQEAVY